MRNFGIVGTAILLALMMPRVTAAPGWALQRAPAPGAPSGEFRGVSCTSARLCTAVGDFVTVRGLATLAERWNGAKWKIQRTPDPPNAVTSSVLSAVSCTSATSCTAVGYYHIRASTTVTLAERWNGATWIVQRSPNPAGAVSDALGAVSCTSAAACTAVGSFTTRAGVVKTLAERWNGTRWKIQATANPSGDSRSTLSGVSCTSAARCVAVGAGNRTGPLAERWNGTKWTIQHVPNPGDAQLNAVSCTSASACAAVGDYFQVGTDVTLAERWNGTKWKIEGTPNLNEMSSVLNAVSCASRTACTAIGESQDFQANTVPLAERWNGTRWTVQAIPAAVIAVSCPSRTACTAVGGEGVGLTLAEAWNGKKWAVQATPNPIGAAQSTLSGVSCTSATACTAVGYSTGLTLAERWDGTRWTIQRTPSPAGALFAALAGVSCTSATACMAVGEFTNSRGIIMTLAERWNGARWTIQRTPNPANSFAHLNAVSCTSASECTAVGFADIPSARAGLAERWNGTTWTIQSVPNPPGTTSSVLSGVSCTSATACTAVGDFPAPGFAHLPLAETWNGTTWSLQKVPNPAGTNGEALFAVSCTSASACTAVGSRFGTVLALAERWNGATWSIEKVPNPSGAVFDSVSCSSANACIAVGSYGLPLTPALTLVEAWNGSSWAIQATPNPLGAADSDLDAVSCTTPAACTAVGSFTNSADTQVPLAEHHS